MSDAAQRRKAYSGEAKTFVGMVLFLIGFFIWLDYREERHDEISHQECASLNLQWKEVYLSHFDMVDDLSVETFDCPSRVSGLARGLMLLEEIEHLNDERNVGISFWHLLIEQQPKLGANPTIRFAGLASYVESRIDVNPAILKRGDPVEIAGILVHEARHFQEGRNTHVPCRLNKRRFCDKRLEPDPSRGGAYNHNVLFYDHVLQSDQSSNQHKRSAARLLQEVLDKRINVISPELRKRFQP